MRIVQPWKITDQSASKIPKIVRKLSEVPPVTREKPPEQKSVEIEEYKCSVCGKIVKSKFGLTNHAKTHLK